MRTLASTMLAAAALALCAPGLSLALPLAGGVDRTLAAATASGQAVLVKEQPRRRVVVRRRVETFPFYPGSPAPSAGVYVGGGYPYYYMPNGYPYHYAGTYWPYYYGRYRYPGLDYSPHVFFGFAESDFR
jgi:hypothetical protein